MGLVVVDDVDIVDQVDSGLGGLVHDVRFVGAGSKPAPIRSRAGLEPAPTRHTV